MHEGDILVFPILSLRKLKPRNQVICPSQMAGECIISCALSSLAPEHDLTIICLLFIVIKVFLSIVSIHLYSWSTNKILFSPLWKLLNYLEPSLMITFLNMFFIWLLLYIFTILVAFWFVTKVCHAGLYPKPQRCGFEQGKVVSLSSACTGTPYFE